MRERSRLPMGVIAIALVLFASAAASAAAGCAAFDHRHEAWTRVLTRYDADGWVDYTGLARDRPPDLSAYLAELSSVTQPCYASWTRAQRLAFWINVYNVFTVRLILDHHPARSIRAIGLLPGSAFRRELIPMQTLRARTLTLDEVEHGILRKEFAEPRIHFALVCAAVSCPRLRPEAYRAEDLDRQLEDQALRFLRDPTRNWYDSRARVLHLSSIFRWFGEDFEKAKGSVVAYVAPYMDGATATALREPGVRVEFFDYDWSLNGR